MFVFTTRGVHIGADIKELRATGILRFAGRGLRVNTYGMRDEILGCMGFRV